MAHPLDLFKYCPRCGAAAFQVHDARSKRCEQCGFVYYHNASASTVAVILNDHGELLVTRRAFEPAKGTLDLPGGFVDPDEAIEEGCLREIQEETGAAARVVRYLFSLPNTYCFSGFDVHTADSFFLCELLPGQQVCPSDDAAELFWLPLSELHPEQFGLHSIRKGVERLIRLLKKENTI